MAESSISTEQDLGLPSEYSRRSLGSLVWESVTGSYRVHGDVVNADCVVGFSFSSEEGIGGEIPGRNNEDLASYIRNLDIDKPKILENGLADAYADLFMGSSDVIGIHIQDVPQKYRDGSGAGIFRGDDEFDSWKFALTARDRMERLGLSTPLVVAHPYQMARADAIMQRIGLETITPLGLRQQGNFYGSEVSQWWTRNPWIWGGYSVAVILHHRFVAKPIRI